MHLSQEQLDDAISQIVKKWTSKEVIADLSHPVGMVRDLFVSAMRVDLTTDLRELVNYVITGKQ